MPDNHASHEEGDPAPLALILGQRTERRLGMTGWIGEHPDDGRDIAHLLIHPLGHGVADLMRRLADAFGLPRSDAGPMHQIPPDTVYAQLDDQDPTGRPEIWIHHGQDAWLHRGITNDFGQVLRERRYAVLWIGIDGATDVDQAAGRERYMRRAHRLYVGLIRVMES